MTPLCIWLLFNALVAVALTPCSVISDQSGGAA
jgi:hypothetical protein